jgi:hypothetical protein
MSHRPLTNTSGLKIAAAYCSAPDIQSHCVSQHRGLLPLVKRKLPLSRWLKLEIQVTGTERSDQVRPVCSILEPGRNPRSSPGQAESTSGLPSPTRAIGP